MGAGSCDVGGKKLHGALMPDSGAHCYSYLDRRIWGSPPPLEAQPVASSGRPQPVAGSRSKYVLKSTRISIMKVFTIFVVAASCCVHTSAVKLVQTWADWTEKEWERNKRIMARDRPPFGHPPPKRSPVEMPADLPRASSSPIRNLLPMPKPTFLH